MDWSGVPGAVLLGLSGLALISLLFWAGHAVLDLLGDDIPLGRGSSTKNELAGSGSQEKPSVESRERLSTQQEREEVNEIAGKAWPPAS